MTKRITEGQIVGILNEAEAGIQVPEACLYPVSASWTYTRIKIG
jgi:hypothetical protein